MADVILDTSDLTVHELRQLFHADVARRGQGARRLVLTFVSFGFKHGVPVDADLVFDVPLPAEPALRRRPARADRARRGGRPLHAAASGDA